MSESGMQNKAGVAQLVERDLAKVEVTSSSLVTRSNSSLKSEFRRNGFDVTGLTDQASGQSG